MLEDTVSMSSTFSFTGLSAVYITSSKGYEDSSFPLSQKSPLQKHAKLFKTSPKKRTPGQKQALVLYRCQSFARQSFGR